MNYRIVVSLAIGLSMAFACTNDEPAYAIATSEESLNVQTPEVRISEVASASFAIEVFSNGTIEAYRSAVLKFQQDGLIRHIAVATGERVAQGALIGQLETQVLDIELQQQQALIAKAELEYQDLLLKMGYSVSTQDSISSEVHEMALIRSGLIEHRHKLAELQEKYRQSELRAPFAGVMGSVEAQAHNLSTAFDHVGILMDLNRVWVNFKVLEEEIGLIRKGDPVEVTPFGPNQPILYARVEQINPLVDENGLVDVRALIKNNQVNLIDGMHAQVRIQKNVGAQLALPKDAVLNRNGKDVVFRYAEGKAQWTYVEKAHENQDSVTIRKGLKAGDQVIVQGHTNLAHHTPVRIDTTTITTF